MIELEPCPFCGGKAEFDYDDNGWNWIECQQCHVSSKAGVHAMEDCKPMLAESWNNRVELRKDWQESFHHAQHTIELQKKRLAELEHNDRVFRQVIDILTLNNGGITPGWLLDLEI